MLRSTTAIAALEVGTLIIRRQLLWTYIRFDINTMAVSKALRSSGHENVFICEPEPLSLKNHLAVREVLRNDSEFGDELSRVRMELAGNDYASLSDYVDGKDGILREMLRRERLLTELNNVEKANIRIM